MSARGPRGGRGGGRGDFSDSPRGRGSFSGGRGGRGDDRGGRGGRGGGGRGGGYGAAPEIFAPPGGVPVDANVMNVENKYHTSTGDLSLDSLSLNRQFPLRPGYGLRGEKVLVWANYFKLEIDPGTPERAKPHFHRYKLECKSTGKGAEPKGRKLKRIIEILLEDHFQHVYDRVATDYKATVICCDSLQFDQKVFDVAYRLENEDPPENPIIYQMRVVATGTLAPGDLISYLRSASAGDICDNKEEIIQAMNIIVGHHPKTDPGIVNLGANRHYPADARMEKYSLQSGLEALRGYFVSVRPATGHLLVNVQVKHVACFASGPLPALFKSLRASRGSVHSLLKGVRVQVSHLQKVKNGKKLPRVKTILGLASPQNGRGQDHPPKVANIGAGPKDVQFYIEGPLQGSSSKSAPGGKKGKKGESAGKPPNTKEKDYGYISVFDYFRLAHKFTNMDPTMPVVNVGTMERPSYLPAELCYVESGQATKRKLGPSETREMIKCAVRKPAMNAKSIVNTGSQIIGSSTALNLLGNMGIKLVPKLITVPSRILPGPNIQYKSRNVTPKSASWNLTGVQFPRGATLSQWTYLHLPGEGQNMNIREKVKEFQQTASKQGMRVAEPLSSVNVNVIFKNNDSPEETASNVDAAFKQLLAKHRNLKVLLVVLPKDDAALYNRVKYQGDIQHGIHTICVIATKFNGVQYYANVSLKFNLKLGGANHTLEASKLGIIGQGKTMVVGIDVTHPSPGSSLLAPSVAALVASVDSELSQWPAVLRLQKERKSEMVDSLQEMLESRLIFWSKKNGSLPENILVYRDGVSEGQYSLVLENELPLLRKACERIYPATMTTKGLPRFSVIVVGKRHHTRFYPTNGEKADRSGNTLNGTIVDRGVTETRDWDFFLQAHTALQGTARPAHYFVILNEIFKKPTQPGFTAADLLEDLTHNLCYLFGRATKAVSICPPAYYADLACERARRYLASYYDATPTGSVISGQTGKAPTLVDLQVHADLHNSMFYI
ncbi:hypothetical protein LOZ66_002167 [Ophidiomyces ophidiicola]|nr:hypothetical protein LOZ66_002167 [Ophidiomyces ophidiicola]